MSLLDGVRLEAYGSTVPLRQVANISVPEARLLVVQPWDRSILGDVEKAILRADLGLNPSNDGNIIRVPIPRSPKSVARRWCGTSTSWPKRAGSLCGTSGATPTSRSRR